MPGLVEKPEVLASVPHAVVLRFEFAFLGVKLFTAEELPGAVDGPVAEGAGAGEVEGARG